jgi:16S rRNA G966 N2-methylase RsmD
MIDSKFKAVCWHLPRPSKSKYKGSWPLHFETKIKNFLGIKDEKILHIFSGKSPLGLRCDISKEVNPDILCDSHNLPFQDNSFDVVVADPPYNDNYSKDLYNAPKIKPTKYINEMVRVCKKDGLIVLYHYYMNRTPLNCKYLGVIAIVTRVFHKARIVGIYKKLI